MLQFPDFKKGYEVMKFSSTKVDKYVSKFAIWFPNLQLYWLLRSTRPICQRTLQRGAVKACEINCNYTYMSVSHLLWNLRNYLSITALCQQTCLPSIISNIEDHKNEIWKTVRLTSFKGPNCHPFQFFLSLSTCYLITPKAIFICTHSCSLLYYLNLLFMFWAVFLCFTEIGGGLHCCSFDKFCDTAPLSC